MFRPDFRSFGFDIDPWRELRNLQRRMNQLFDEESYFPENNYPAVNVWTGDEDLVMVAELPGITNEDLDISVQGKTLTLRGNRKLPDPSDKRVYHRQERMGGSFARTFHLPFEIESDKVDAKLENGILYLKLPRSEKDKPKKISVKVT